MATTTPTPNGTVGRKKPTAITEDNVEAFLEEFDTFVCDLDGVVWHLIGSAIAGAIEGLHRLKAAGKKILFVTNNSLPRFERLRKLGFEVQKDELAYPSVAMARHLQQIGFKKKAFVLAVEACKEEMLAHGIDVVHHTSGERVEENVEAVFRATQDDPDVGAVVMDVDLNVSYMDLAKAVVYLRRPDCLLLTGATERRLPVAHTVLPGPGLFPSLVEELAGRKALAFGKPSPLMVTEFLSEAHNLDMRRCIFVGDTLWQDMGTAKACGMKSLLTLSGVTALEDLETCDPDLLPDYHASSLAVFSHLLPKGPKPAL